MTPGSAVSRALSMQEGGGPLSDPTEDAGMLVGTVVAPNVAPDADEVPLAVTESALVAQANPLTNLIPMRGGLTKYRVRSGDTISKIATQFNISVDTIKWANPDLKGSVRKGQEITILPVTGLAYAVHDGDSLESIAARFQIGADAIKQYNQDYQELLASHDGLLVLPGAKLPKGVSAADLANPSLPDLKNYFTLPASGWNWGELHEHNAVDIANQCGTPVHASAEGVVVPDERYGDGTTGWNDGYGTFVLVEHPNGTRTRYAHLEKVSVSLGDYLKQGDTLGEIGNTGNTHGPTGCHVHFEVYGAKNPFAIR
jgi:murein DD-endopeptidase MepM/ murein hydrolase activator NlpD